MKYEKQRVSMLNTVIARMNNNVYDSQQDLMRAILKKHTIASISMKLKRHFQLKDNFF